MVKIDDFVKTNLAFFHHPRRIPNPYYRCKNARRKIKYPVPVKTSRKNSSIIADYHDIGGFIPESKPDRRRNDTIAAMSAGREIL
jgi:hypothetical protein